MLTCKVFVGGETMNQIATIKKERPRDELWDTLTNVLGYNPKDITRNIRGQLNSALAQLREIQATPQDIIERAGIFQYMYPSIKMTAMGLINRWADLTPSNLSKVMPEKIRNEQIIKFHESMDDGRIFDEMVKEGTIDAQGNPIKKLK